MRILREANYRRMPWKNGGGETIEIARWPEKASLDDFEWRVSRAKVPTSGSFSEFPGVDRTLAVMEGAGIVLNFAGQPDVTLNRELPPYTFSGDRAIDSRLIDGPIDDLNVMSRRGRVRHSVVRMKLSAAAVLQCRADITAVIVGSGKIQVRAGRRTKPLAALETLIVDDESEANLQIMTDNEAELFVVDLWHC